MGDGWIECTKPGPKEKEPREAEEEEQRWRREQNRAIRREVERAQREPGRKPGEEPQHHPHNPRLCLSATLLQGLGWGADTTSWGCRLSKAPWGPGGRQAGSPGPRCQEMRVSKPQSVSRVSSKLGLEAQLGPSALWLPPLTLWHRTPYREEALETEGIHIYRVPAVYPSAC